MSYCTTAYPPLAASCCALAAGTHNTPGAECFWAAHNARSAVDFCDCVRHAVAFNAALQILTTLDDGRTVGCSPSVPSVPSVPQALDGSGGEAPWALLVATV